MAGRSLDDWYLRLHAEELKGHLMKVTNNKLIWTHNLGDYVKSN